MIPQQLRFLMAKVKKYEECLNSIRPFCKPAGAEELIKSQKTLLSQLESSTNKFHKENNLKDLAIVGEKLVQVSKDMSTESKPLTQLLNFEFEMEFLADQSLFTEAQNRFFKDEKEYRKQVKEQREKSKELEWQKLMDGFKAKLTERDDTIEKLKKEAKDWMTKFQSF